MRVLLTGATGFIGQAIVRRVLSDSQHLLIAAIRQQSAELYPAVATEIVGDLSYNTDWSSALDGVEVVIHTAARAHVLYEQVSNPLEEFRRVNVGGTLALAQQAARAGVKRFIFISSIGVSGNKSTRPFTANDVPCPEEPYAVSKYEAELALLDLVIKKDMEVVIIRPPLVYGPNAPGNFARLIKLVSRGGHLLLGAVHNQRSFVALDNLVDLIVTCIDHPSAANQILLVSDGEDLSITELLRRVSVLMGKPAHMLPVPCLVLKAVAMLLGKHANAQRLLNSLQVDISKTRELLNWSPPISVNDALRKSVKGMAQAWRD